MADIPDKDIANSRAAFAPTLNATAAILPWVGKSQPLRFPPALNQRWQNACKSLANCWSARAQHGPQAIRPQVFALLEIALECGDPDVLYLCETLASVADHFEHSLPGARLIAALTATTEALIDQGGLEQPLLLNRAQHFSRRLTAALQPSSKPGERSDVLDGLFVQDSEERLSRMREALDVLPIDVYSLEVESSELMQHAEQIDMWGIYHLARQLQSFVLQLCDASEAVQDQARRDILAQLALLDAAVNAIDC